MFNTDTDQQMSPSNHWYSPFSTVNQIIMTGPIWKVGNLSYANQAFNLFYLHDQHTIIQTLLTNIPFLGEGTKYYTNINTVRIKPFQKGQWVRWECFYCRCRYSGRPCARFTGVGGLWLLEVSSGSRKDRTLEPRLTILVHRSQRWRPWL